MPRVRKEPAYTRLDVDERRRRLLALGAELFSTHAYSELTMAGIAKAAGISKPLLYHYFTSKQAFLRAALAESAAEVASAVTSATDPHTPALQQLSDGLGAFLGWIEEHGLAYRKLIENAGSVPEVSELVESVREPTAARILAGLSVGTNHKPPPPARAAVKAWLWFMDGAILDWLTNRDFTREQLRDVLIAALLGALAAAGLQAQPVD